MTKWHLCLWRTENGWMRLHSKNPDICGCYHPGTVNNRLLYPGCGTTKCGHYCIDSLDDCVTQQEFVVVLNLCMQGSHTWQFSWSEQGPYIIYFTVLCCNRVQNNALCVCGFAFFAFWEGGGIFTYYDHWVGLLGASNNDVHSLFFCICFVYNVWLRKYKDLSDPHWAVNLYCPVRNHGCIKYIQASGLQKSKLSLLWCYEAGQIKWNIPVTCNNVFNGPAL